MSGGGTSRRSVWRSLVAGALIGFAESSRLDLQRRGLDRPPGVFRVADRLSARRLIEGIPLILLDPIPPPTPPQDRGRPDRTGSLLLTPVRLIGGVRRWLESRAALN